MNSSRIVSEIGVARWRVPHGVQQRAFAMLAWLALALVPLQARADVYCVDAGAPAGGNGACWSNPFNSLGAALAAAAARGGSNEVWVKSGTYRPATPATGSPRGGSFRLVGGTAVYGGFAGGETARAQRNADPASNNTVLSGDLAGDDVPGFGNRSDNANNVVVVDVANGPVVLDGFVVRGGSAVDVAAQGFPRGVIGGGLRLDRGSLVVRNVRFVDNEAAIGGGGAAVLFTTPSDAARFSACEFVGNRVSFGGEIYGGGGLYLQSVAQSAVTHSRFLGNRCDGDACSGGGLMIASESTPSTLVSNNVFSGNEATANSGASGLPLDYGGGGGIWIGGLGADVVNTTLYANRVGGAVTISQAITVSAGTMNLRNSIVDRGIGRRSGATINYRANLIRTCAGPLVAPGPGLPLNCQGNDQGLNFREAPAFVNADGNDAVAGTVDDDLRLASGSPAIDAGDNAAVGNDVTDIDQDGVTNEAVALDLAREARRVDVHGQPDAVAGAAPEVDLGPYETADGEVSIIGATQTVGEGTAGVSVLVRVSTTSAAALASPISVVASAVPGTALELVNYLPVVQSVVFPAGTLNGTVQSVSIPIVDNVVPQPPVTFQLRLGSPSNAALEAPTAQAITIIDNDGLSVLAAGGVAGQTLSFPVRLPASTTAPIAVSYRLISGTALAGVDFDPATQELIIPPGLVEAEIPVRTFVFTAGPPRTFEIELLSASGLTISQRRATGTIAPRPEAVFSDGFE